MRDFPRLFFLFGLTLMILVVFTKTSFASDAQSIIDKVRKSATGVLVVNENPIKVETVAENKGTKAFNVETLILQPNQNMIVAEATGSGTFSDIWYSTNSPDMLLTVTIDGSEIWKDATHAFCLNKMLNNTHVGFAGPTGCGQTQNEAGQLWGGYITPPQGYPFKRYLKVEFRNNDTEEKIIHSVRGHYVLN